MKIILKIMFMFSPAVLYAVGAVTRFVWFARRRPEVDLWATNRVQGLIRELLIMLIPLIISAVLYCFFIAKKKLGYADAFRAWLICSAIISMFWTSLFDGVILMWYYIRFSSDDIQLWLIYFSYLLYIVVIVFFLIDVKKNLKNKKEAKNENN